VAEMPIHVVATAAAYHLFDHIDGIEGIKDADFPQVEPGSICDDDAAQVGQFLPDARRGARARCHCR